MDARDVDALARAFGSACTRRRALRIAAAGAWMALSGRRTRFDALAASLCCCKCSGTRACEDDVQSLSECTQLCGTRQAIFSCNHTCQPGKTATKICKLKRRKTTSAVLTVEQPGVYDLAFFDAAGAETLGPGAISVSDSAFAVDAALAAGYVREAGAQVLFAEAVSSFRSNRGVHDGNLIVLNFLSQHATVAGAEQWRAYAAAQLWPPEAEELTQELSEVDAGDLYRFSFPSTEVPGATVTRLTGITRVGEFVHWFAVDGTDEAPTAELGLSFQQATADAIVDRPEATESLAPYAWLPAETLGCIEFGGGQSGARLFGVRRQSPCEAAKLDVRYSVKRRTYTPPVGARPEAVDATKRFYADATTALTYTYQVGTQTRTITIVRWGDPGVIANGGKVFFARLAELDRLNGVRRAGVERDGEIVDPSLSAFAFATQNGSAEGVEKTVFAPPFSISLRIVQAGAAIDDVRTWDPRTDPAVRALADQLGGDSANTNLEAVQTGNLLKNAFQYPVWGVVGSSNGR